MAGFRETVVGLAGGAGYRVDEVLLGDAGTVDYFELEAELLEPGTEDDLTKFVEALQARWSLQPENKSKFERALAQIDS